MTKSKVAPPGWVQKDVNHALTESTRPPMYTAMKYWGKKPHNIWAEFIDSYCPPGGTVLDPFSGSAIAGFEALKLGRKALCFDLNPLTTFLVETLTQPFCEDEFVEAYNAVFDAVEANKHYRSHYYKNWDGGQALIYNYRWHQGAVVKLAIETPDNKRLLINADDSDRRNAKSQAKLAIPFWHPKEQFPQTPSITHKFVKDIGGNGFQHLWTRRNLYLLALIFAEILKQPKQAVKQQLLFAFLQTLHLTSKMVVPRDTKSGRDFSGSWGRADYMVRSRSMEQNPLVVFQRSCIEKQSTLSCLQDASITLPKKVKCTEVKSGKKFGAGANLVYGIVDVADLESYVKPKSVDFVITDPPYAGLVRYLDLSMVWLVWLKHVDKKYAPDLGAEITIKKGVVERAEYSRRLENAFKQINRALKDDGKLVVTFHHKQIKEWNEFIRSVLAAGFEIEKVTHQYNRRSGEANVANPYGTSGTDFYIRCIKNPNVTPGDSASDLRQVVLQSAITTVASRNEKTAFNFITPGVMPAVINAGFLAPSSYQGEILKILNDEEGPGKIFVRTTNNDNKAGDYWWFNDPQRYINHPDLPLTARVDETILALLRRRVSVTFDDVLADIFRTFPNGLTPDPKSIQKVLGKYAVKSAGKWKITSSAIRIGTEHTEAIRQILEIGKKAGYKVFVGKREQPEPCSDGSVLRSHANIHELACLPHSYTAESKSRLEMIDALWLDGASVACAFEVEHSTDFMSAIQRGSNLPATVPKYMVVPATRIAELLSKSDPLFKESFKRNTWRYIERPDIARLAGFSHPTISEVVNIAKELSDD